MKSYINKKVRKSLKDIGPQEHASKRGTMNRHQRRAAKAQGINTKLNRIIAIHEAGHAVARVLSAPDFGIPAEHMVLGIDVGTCENIGQSPLANSMTLGSQAVTYGPMLSAELQAVLFRITQDIDPNKLTSSHIASAIKVARDEGINVTGWLRARMLISTFASVAEGLFTGRPLADVWNSPASEADRIGAFTDGAHAGLSTDEMGVYINDAFHQSVDLLKQANIRHAIEALSEALPISGRFDGRRATSIITRALASS